MDAEVKDGRVIVEGLLCAVSMVDVPVNDGDATEPIAVLEIFGPDGNVVEETKPHGVVPFGMMSRGADGAEGVGRPSTHHGVNGGQDSPGRHRGGVVGSRGADGDVVRFE